MLGLKECSLFADCSDLDPVYDEEGLIEEEEQQPEHMPNHIEVPEIYMWAHHVIFLQSLNHEHHEYLLDGVSLQSLSLDGSEEDEDDHRVILGEQNLNFLNVQPPAPGKPNLCFFDVTDCYVEPVQVPVQPEDEEEEDDDDDAAEAVEDFVRYPHQPRDRDDEGGAGAFGNGAGENEEEEEPKTKNSANPENEGRSRGSAGGGVQCERASANFPRKQASSRA